VGEYIFVKKRHRLTQLHPAQHTACRHFVSYSPGGSTRREVGPGGAFWTPFERRGGRRRSAMVPFEFERALVVSYRLSIVTIALSLTIRPQFVTACLRRSHYLGVGRLRQNLGGIGWPM